MREFLIENLPASDAIDIVILSASTAHRVTGEMNEWLTQHCIRVDEPTRKAIDLLCRSLPLSESMRCHTPPAGLRFYMNGVLRCAFSICWACNNAYGEYDGQSIVVRFDGTSASARELFAVMQNIVGADFLSNAEIQ